jgi:hypothetical protein
MKVSKRGLLWLVIFSILVLVPGLFLRKVHRNVSSASIQVSSPAQVVYEFVKESGGTTPSRGSKILLGFDPNGEAYVYALRPGEWVAYHGHWSYAGGRMSLKISTPSLSVDAHFPLNLTDENVTMPFQIFAGAPGTSQWKASVLSLDAGIFAVYDAAVADSGLALSQGDAVQRALDYAQARIQLDKTSVTSALPSAERADVLPLAIASFADSNNDSLVCDAPRVINVRRIDPDAFLLTYECGSGGIVRGQVFTVEITLQPPLDSFSPQSSLAPALLSGDPRVHIYPQSPGDSAADPPGKTAVIVAPYVDHDAQGNENDVNDVQHWSDYFGGNATPAPDPSKFSIVPALKQDGYGDPVTLINDDATVVKIAEAVTKVPTPGVVLFLTHGSSYGLDTGEHWHSSNDDCTKPNKKCWGYGVVERELRNAGLGDLWDFDRPDGGLPVTLGLCEIQSYFQGPKTPWVEVCLRPKFWEWARLKRRADFTHSLVYIGACETDETEDLRKAIQAGAYFAWKKDVQSGLNAAVESYLVASLSRPTHTAEESYYNLMRIANSQQMIYVEDKLLDGKLGSGPSDMHNLDAYGWDGGSVLDYRDAGWYGTAEKQKDAFNAGQVWWLLFVERWSPNRDDGKIKIANCWDQFWSHGDLGGLRSPQCQNYNNGSLPKADEVGYATYLLTGATDPGFSGTKVPRWTLNDGRPAQSSSQ